MDAWANDPDRTTRREAFAEPKIGEVRLPNGSYVPTFNGQRVVTVWDAEIGAPILANGRYEIVTEIILHAPGHDLRAIRSDWYCVEVRTTGVTRYCGHDPAKVASMVNAGWKLAGH